MREVPIGWVGFDGGSKRAISFARGPDPNVEDEPPLKPTRPKCHEDGTSLDVTLAGLTLCGCANNDIPEYYDTVDDPAALLGVHTVPLGTITSIGFLDMQAFAEEGCITPVGMPVSVEIFMLVTCFAGRYFVDVSFTPPTATPQSVSVFAAGGSLNETIPNGIGCSTGAVNRPFVFDEAEVSLA